MAKKQQSTTTKTFSAVRAGDRYYCGEDEQGRIKPIVCETDDVVTFVHDLADLLQGFDVILDDIYAPPTDDFVDYLTLTDLPYLESAFVGDEAALILAGSKHLQVREVRAEEMSSFHDSFVYSAKDLRYEDSRYGIWLPPNLPTALTGVESLMNELLADLYKWQAVVQVLHQPTLGRATPIEITAGDDLNKVVDSLNRAFEQFDNYGIARQ